MMIKLIVFDLDGTLAEFGKGMLDSNIELLKKIEDTGVNVAVCSGKPCYYLCGFMRQIGLKHPILVGENGGEIVFGVDLPPVVHKVLPYSEDAKRSLRFLRDGFDSLIPDIWYQPNNVGLTPFLKREEDFETVAGFIKENEHKLKDIVVYRHFDCFDIMPEGIDKGNGVKYLANMLKIERDEILAVGDSINDYPMFEFAGFSVGVKVSDTSRVDSDFNTIGEALEFILDKLLTIVKINDILY